MLNELVVAIMEPCAYLMSAELYPSHVRAKGVALSFGFLALTNTWVIEASSTMIQALKWKGAPRDVTGTLTLTSTLQGTSYSSASPPFMFVILISEVLSNISICR